MEKKVASLFKFENELFSLHLQREADDASVIFYSGIIKNCREVCVKFEENSFSQKEQICMRNCASKYCRIPSLLRNNNDKGLYETSISGLGPRAVIASDEQIKLLENMFGEIQEKKEAAIKKQEQPKL